MTYNEMVHKLNEADEELRCVVAAVEALHTEGIALCETDSRYRLLVVKPNSAMAISMLEHLNILRDEAAIRRNTLANLKDRVDDMINSAEVL